MFTLIAGRPRGRGRATLAVLLGLAVVAAGCRGGDGEEEAEGRGGIKVDFGVTDEPCPDAVNAENGCIYLGTVSDLTEGPFAALAVPITDSQAAFWRRVNEQGGIGGYDIDTASFVRDNKYNPQIHNQVYQEIKGDILALAQTLGSPTTAAILEDLKSNNIVAAPASWTSLWEFEETILESGGSYCVEAMNAVDYAVEQMQISSVMAVHNAGDYGDDAAAGTQIAADAHGVNFADTETQSGQDNQGGAIDAIVSQNPDLVVLTTGPTDAAVIVGQAAARGYQGQFIGSGPTWNPGLLQSPAAPALQAQYLQVGPWHTFTSDTPAHQAMREALGDVEPNDGYTSGWAWSYPLKAAIELAIENGDLTRAGLVEATRSLETVDYEGMLPAEAGKFSGDANETVFRQSVISKPDPASPTGVTVIEDFFTGPTAQEHDFSSPCYQ